MAGWRRRAPHAGRRKPQEPEKPPKGVLYWTLLVVGALPFVWVALKVADAVL